METIFNALECRGQDKKRLVIFELAYSTAEWWETGRIAIQEDAIQELIWELFKVKFLRKYFLTSKIYKKEVEFLALF